MKKELQIDRKRIHTEEKRNYMITRKYKDRGESSI